MTANKQIGSTYDAIFIAGPTASGKSAVANELAKRLGGAIVNADSMQVYRDLRILTSRPSKAEEAEVPHRLYGVLDGGDACSAAKWTEMAAHAIGEEQNAGRLPILVGGTGLYFRALIDGLSPIPDVPEEVSDAARDRFLALGAQIFHAELGKFDPESAAQINPADRQRLERAWSVYEHTAVPLSEWQSLPLKPAVAGTFLQIVLSLDRPTLYARCDGRFEAMVEAGAQAEVDALAARNLDPSLPVMKAIGVRELMDVRTGEGTLQSAIQQAQTNTRRYAKRQETWFRNQMIAWKRVSAQYLERSIEEIFTIICESA